MRLAGVELLRVRLPLKRAFTTSFGTSAEKECVLVRALGPDDAEGWGECTAMEAPRYSGEWNDGAWLVLRDHLVPAALAVAERESASGLDLLIAIAAGYEVAIRIGEAVNRLALRG
jgi:O-succinylbenzoate synthase